MAGDWIPMRTNILTDPAVFIIATETGLTIFDTVGRLTAVWAWASEHIEDGIAQVPGSILDRIADHEGFAVAMESAGWLVIHDSMIEFPAWEAWLGQSAKKRMRDAKRKAKSRTPDTCPPETGHHADKCPHGSGQTSAEKRTGGGHSADKSVTTTTGQQQDNNNTSVVVNKTNNNKCSVDRPDVRAALRAAGLTTKSVLDEFVADQTITVDTVERVAAYVQRSGGGAGALVNTLRDSEARQTAMRKAGGTWDYSKHSKAIDERQAARKAEDDKVLAERAEHVERLRGVWKNLKGAERQSVLSSAQGRASPPTLWKPIKADGDPGKWPFFTGELICDELRERGILPCNSS